MRISTVAAFSSAAYALNGRQSELAKLSAQISSGKRILTPSDDPEGFARSVELESAVARNNQLQNNQAAAANTLSQAESLLGTINEVYSDIRSVLVQAGNPSLSNSDRKVLAAELAARREALYGLSTSPDHDGQPFFGERLIQVGTSRELDVTLNHSQLFAQVRNGNGVFAAAATAGSSGNAAISAGSVADAAALDGNNYNLVFHNSAGTVTFDVVNATTSTVVSSGHAFSSGAAISVAGMSVKVTGVPTDGDTFSLTPSTKRDIFTALDEWVQALNAPVSDDASRARLSASIAAGLAQVDQAAQTTQLARANAGAALQEIDTLQAIAGTQDEQLQTQLSERRDLDYAKAATELSQRQLVLEAAQKAYSKTLGRSLFDYM